MLRLPLPVCIRCRREILQQILPEKAFASPGRLFHLSAIAHRTGNRPNTGRPQHTAAPYTSRLQNRSRPQNFKTTAPRRVDPHGARVLLNKDLPHWAQAVTIRERLKGMGVLMPHSQYLLDAFVSQTPEGGYFPPEEDGIWQMDRLADEMSQNRRMATDRGLTRRFMAWVQTPAAKHVVPVHISEMLAAVQEAADVSYPHEWYPQARAMRRKIIMHVGPTNSGKTHHALRALAAARMGTYAGPLRLLAHEIFDRLNKGEIVPAGANPDDPPEKHARACNLVTGEEQRIISEDTKLVSCTVEMLNLRARWDVAVVDEIQMIADPDRGGAWTAALLGLNADEIHLCGEDSVVPLIQTMMKDTGDELVINRYERLTPLTVAPMSLEGDLTRVGKGDCLIAFSRSGIFSLKKAIEQKTGLRCAVAYGRLPPETRTEQAALFNDPKSEYDVLVGSDAIGMGLNLKIKRIIFHSVSKWDGSKEATLSLSQLKQIAGRAGRFGLHGDGAVGGVATTLFEPDLPILRRALSSVVTSSVKRAVLPTTIENFSAIEQVISTTSFRDIFDVQNYVSVLRPSYTLASMPVAGEAGTFIDRNCRDFSLAEKMMLFNAPVPWRDSLASEAMIRFLRMYRNQGCVDLRKGLRGLGLAEALEDVTEMQQTDAVPVSSPQTLSLLETLYKILVCYLWLSFRSPLAFHLRDDATQMKHQTEAAIEWCLEGIESRRAVPVRPGDKETRSSKYGVSAVSFSDGPPTRIQASKL